MFSYFDTIPACDRRTDRRVDILLRHTPRYENASRGENAMLISLPFSPAIAHALDRSKVRSEIEDMIFSFQLMNISCINNCVSFINCLFRFLTVMITINCVHSLIILLLTFRFH